MYKLIAALLLISLIQAVTASPASAPIGHTRTFLRIRVTETPSGTVLQDVWYQRWVEEVE